MRSSAGRGETGFAVRDKLTSWDKERVADESQLIDRALQGDRQSFAQLVTENQDRLFASMLHVTGSPDEAEEVVQEAFIRAFIKLDTFQRNSQFFTWLYRIAFNNALTRRRRKRARFSIEQGRESSGLEVIDDGEGVDERMLRDERVAAVRVALDQLTPEHRGILILREMEEHSYETIADILQISIGTVRSRLSRARRQLKLTIEAIQESQQPNP
ncbi:MAG: sigma-70 family RNA polymerase sigma factor [Planctomycetota bacterium]